MELCPTGIEGLDHILGGGFPRNRTILLAGPTGSGKTTLAVQFLYNGAEIYDEPGVLVLLEEDPKEVKEDMLNLGFDLEKQEAANKLLIVDTSLARIAEQRKPIELKEVELPPGSVSLLPEEFKSAEELMDIVLKKANEINAKRLVIDSLPALEFLILPEAKDLQELKQRIRQLVVSMTYRFKLAGLTTILVTELEAEERTLYGVESYVVDGLILLTYTETGYRALQIRKMRGIKHTLAHYEFRIDKGGIHILKQPIFLR